MSPLGSSAIAVVERRGLRYPMAPPFGPPVAFPELPATATDPSNHIYAAVRDLLLLLGLDRAHAGTPAWNPLGEIVHPGDRVVIKPNLVRESHQSRPDEWEHVVTHAAVVRPILDYVIKALDGRGHITIADGPQTDSSFDRICARAGYRELAHYAASGGVPVELVDFRREEWTTKDNVIVHKRALPGDPLGYTQVELDADSEFVGCPGEGRYYGASFDTDETNTVHHGTRHAYMISRTVQACDVLINVPKLKTHKKAGITCCLKNLVGINGNKNWLPHFTIGDAAIGGDEFERAGGKRTLERSLMGAFRSVALRSPRPVLELLRYTKKLGRAYFGDTDEVVRNGNWRGNATIWRMILDLNKAMLYFDGDGRRRATPRRFFAIVDGVLAGDGNGPLAPDLFEAGTLIAGTNAVAIDCAAATLMGFDWRTIPSLAHAFGLARLPLANFEFGDIVSASNVSRFTGRVAEWRRANMFTFRPHFGWVSPAL